MHIKLLYYSFDNIIIEVLMFSLIKSLEDVNSLVYVNKQWAISWVEYVLIISWHLHYWVVEKHEINYKFILHLSAALV